ncbi:hypothetical protein ACFU76_16380 [Streptomyces sp. NPDC057539]
MGQVATAVSDVRLPVVPVGPERIRSVLRRPSLAGLESGVFIWHRLTS